MVPQRKAAAPYPRCFKHDSCVRNRCATISARCRHRYSIAHAVTQSQQRRPTLLSARQHFASTLARCRRAKPLLGISYAANNLSAGETDAPLFLREVGASTASLTLYVSARSTSTHTTFASTGRDPTALSCYRAPQSQQTAQFPLKQVHCSIFSWAKRRQRKKGTARFLPDQACPAPVASRIRCPAPDIASNAAPRGRIRYWPSLERMTLRRCAAGRHNRALVPVRARW
jgi:hypothetical protein